MSPHLVFIVPDYQHRRMAYRDYIDILSEDFDDSARSIEEQIVNDFDLDLNEEADIKEAGHVW